MISQDHVVGLTVIFLDIVLLCSLYLIEKLVDRYKAKKEEHHPKILG